MPIPALTVNLPPAITVGDRVGVRAQPHNPGGFSVVKVFPDFMDKINGSASFTVATRTPVSIADPYWGSCFTFVVGVARDGPAGGEWWIESAYFAPWDE